MPTKIVKCVEDWQLSDLAEAPRRAAGTQSPAALTCTDTQCTLRRVLAEHRGSGVRCYELFLTSSLMTDPWIDHKDSCAQCGALRVMIADGLCRTCWRDTNGDAEMEREDRYAD